MSQEKIKVLEMLENGIINTEDALKLLQELEKNQPTQYGNGAPRYDNRAENRPKHEHIRKDVNLDFGWVDELKDGIMESVQNITESIGPIIQDRGDIFYSSGSEPIAHYSYKSDDVGEKIKALNVKGKNSKIEIVPADENFISIDVSYKARRHTDPHICVEENNGEYSLSFDYNAVQALGVYVKVPRVYIDSLYAETTNSPISAYDLNANKAEIYTKNARIRLRNMRGEFMHAETKNSSVATEGIDYKELVIYSSNGSIDIENANSAEARIKTSNSSIGLNGVDIRYINAITSNGKINIKRLGDMFNTQYPNYSIEAVTSNAGIYVDLGENINIPMKVKASTSSNKINCDAGNLIYKANEKNYIEAISPDYNEAQKSLDLSLQTSNGKIEIA